MPGGDLDPRTFALVRIAALVALGAPRASHAREVAGALDDGARPEEIFGVLDAVAPLVGEPRVAAAAAAIAAELGPAVADERVR